MSEWRFKFPYYISEHLTIDNGLAYTVTRKYFFITFWLIYFIHGDQRIRGLSSKSYLTKELSND
jgi:hypothetical protein